MMSTAANRCDVRYPTPPRAASGTSFAGIMARMVAAIATEYRIRRDTRALMQTSDQMLKDIGLSRSEIRHAVRFGRGA